MRGIRRGERPTPLGHERVVFPLGSTAPRTFPTISETKPGKLDAFIPYHSLERIRDRRSDASLRGTDWWNLRALRNLLQTACLVPRSSVGIVRANASGAQRRPAPRMTEEKSQLRAQFGGSPWPSEMKQETGV